MQEKARRLPGFHFELPELGLSGHSVSIACVASIHSRAAREAPCQTPHQMTRRYLLNPGCLCQVFLIGIGEHFVPHFGVADLGGEPIRC